MRSLAAGLLVLGMAAGAGAASAADQETQDDTTGATLPPPAPPGQQQQPEARGLGADIKAYVTAPLHWDTEEWLGFGGAVAAVAIAHQYDRQTAAPYQTSAIEKSGSHDLEDIAPAAALLAGTSVLAYFSGSTAGSRESVTMLEAASFSGVTAYALKYAVGRESPAETTNPNAFGHGAGSFPSLHSTVAFAIGGVLAESGGDDYRWLRRVLGYGVGVFTSYQRIKHDQHWLSDTVAGAALGISTAQFSIHRRNPDDDHTGGNLSVEPVAGGAMLSYSKSF